MFSNKTSRSHSVSSLLSDNANEINEHVNDINVIEINNSEPESAPNTNDLSYRYTAGHPQGAALL
jgi:hypothetical protein